MCGNLGVKLGCGAESAAIGVYAPRSRPGRSAPPDSCATLSSSSSSKIRCDGDVPRLIVRRFFAEAFFLGCCSFLPRPGPPARSFLGAAPPLAPAVEADAVAEDAAEEGTSPSSFFDILLRPILRTKEEGRRSREGGIVHSSFTVGTDLQCFLSFRSPNTVLHHLVMDGEILQERNFSSFVLTSFSCAVVLPVQTRSPPPPMDTGAEIQKAEQELQDAQRRANEAESLARTLEAEALKVSKKKSVRK
jgi:hypothetical protein